MDLPLAGVRVLELGGGIPAAFATRMLAGYGADVVRVDGAETERLNDDAATYLLAGKRRVRAAGEHLRQLALACDIVVEDGPPGALATQGLDPQDLRRSRPELVVVSLTPFGQTGPYAAFQATNAVSFALGGIMSLTGDLDHAPLISGGGQALYLGGLNGFAAAVTAYFGALVHGEGDWIDVSLQEAAAAMVELYVPGTAYGSPVQLRAGNHVRATWGLYPCVDGWGGVFCLERQIPSLFRCLADPELDEARFRQPLLRAEPDTDAELEAKLYGFFSGVTKADLLELGPRYKVPFGVVLTPNDLLDAPGLAHRAFFDEVHRPDGTAAIVPGRPFPGYGWADLSELHEPGADTAAVDADWGTAA